MMKRLPIVIAVVALASGGTASAVLAGSPQDTQAGPGRSGNWQQSGAWTQNRSALIDARIAALHAGLQLNPDQEKLWPPVETAIRNFCKLLASHWHARRSQEQSSDPVERLERRSDALIARGQALRKIVDAAKPLYAILNDAQRERLPILLRVIRHSMMGRFMHHRSMWRNKEERNNNEESNGEDQHHQGMGQPMNGDQMMMDHEDHEDHSGYGNHDQNGDYDNDGD